jgi:hypothetical protein
MTRAGPRGQRAAARGRQRDAGGRLVRRRGQHGVRAAALQDVDAHPVAVDRHRHHVGATLGQHHPVARHPGVLDRDPRRPAEQRPQRHREQAEGMLGPGGDHDAPALGHHAARAAQVDGELGAERGIAARVGVAECAVGHAAQGLACASQPVRPREAGQVGGAGEEVVAQAGRARCRPGLGRRAPGVAVGAHVGARAGAGLEVALGPQLLVGLDHEPPRDPEVVRQHARGGQARVGCEASGADPLAQAGLELGAQRRAPVAPELDQDLRANGPLFGHRIGP